MDCCKPLKTWDICVNSLIFPGVFMNSSYSVEDYPLCRDLLNGLNLIFIPFTDKSVPFSGPKFIPALLNIAEFNKGSVFCIHFHGNACDIGQVAGCAQIESNAFMAHYLVVEYPMYGINKDGYASEETLNKVAESVYKFVVDELRVPSNRIVLIGRSIGTGPTCTLASNLEARNKKPAAVILHAPYTSLRDAAYDILGCFSFLFLNRWENWKKLCKVKKTISSCNSCGSYENIDETHGMSMSIQPTTGNDAKPFDQPAKSSDNGMVEISQTKGLGLGVDGITTGSADNGDIKPVGLGGLGGVPTTLPMESYYANPLLHGRNQPNGSLPNPSTDNLTNGMKQGPPTSSNVSSSQGYSKEEEVVVFVNPSSAAVVSCPVLFIHGDNDKIIDCHHSHMMYQQRKAAGLPGEFFLQKSTPGYKKGHNYYDYHEEVVAPSLRFLNDYVPPTAPHSLPLDKIRVFCSVPPEFANKKGNRIPPAGSSSAIATASDSATGTGVGTGTKGVGTEVGSEIEPSSPPIRQTMQRTVLPPLSEYSLPFPYSRPSSIHSNSSGRPGSQRSQSTTSVPGNPPNLTTGIVITTPAFLSIRNVLKTVTKIPKDEH